MQVLCICDIKSVVFFEYVQVLCTLDVKSKSFKFLTVYECLMRFWVLCAFDINIIVFFLAYAFGEPQVPET